jgi:catechol 2,3-dioxygenase-like lactoylglutathione lyase family enzyme
MPLDHVVYAVPDLDEAVDELERRLGVRAARGGQHPGQGTHNALLSLGDGQYLEIIAPDPDQPAPSGPRPFGVDAAGPKRVAGWAWRVDDIDATVAQARAHGYDPGDAIAMNRLTTDGVELNWRLALGATHEGAVPFLIDWGNTPHPSTAAPTGLTLTSLRIEHPGAATIASALRAIGAHGDVVEAPTLTIVATVAGPTGTTELR